MSLTFIGYVFFIAGLICLVQPHLLPYLLGLSIVFVQTPAVNLSDDIYVSPFYLLCLFVLPMAVFRPLRNEESSRVSSRGKHLIRVLWAFISVGALSGLVLPLIFQGLPVLIPNEGIDRQVLDPGELTLTTSNFAQIIYLVLAGIAVSYVFCNPPRHSYFLLPGFGLGVLLNIWEYLAQNTGLPGLDNLIESSHAEQGAGTVGDIERFAGIFAEPSYLGTFALTASVYAIFCCLKCNGMFVRLTSTLTAFFGLALVALSLSGTGFISIAILTGFILLSGIWTIIRSRVRISVPLLLTPLIVGLIAVFWAPQVVGLFNTVFLDKVDSSSYVNRSLSNEFSWQIFTETGGLGVGLGSSRPSSFLMMLLSNVGAIGTVLFAILVVISLRAARRNSQGLPVYWGLVAVLVAKVVAEPNMSNPLLWVILAECAVIARRNSLDEISGSSVYEMTLDKETKVVSDSPA